MKNLLIKKIFILLLCFYSSLFAWVPIPGGEVDFTTDADFHLLYGGEGTALFGDFNATGNSILTSSNPTNASLINDTTTYKTIDADFNTATYSLGDTEKMNSSSANIVLPDYVKGSDIVWAGLFWQGHVLREGGAITTAAIDADIVGWNNVSIKDANGTMHQITAPVGSNNLDHKAFHYTTTDGTGYRHHYGAYHEVTDIVKNSYATAQNTFTVGNIKTTAGQDNGEYVYIAQAPAASGVFRFGLYGGWSLMVVYNVDSVTAQANNVSLKNVSIYDGYDLFLTWGAGTVPFETTIDISGFYTPKSGPVSSKLLLFGGGGDRSINDDTLQIQNGTSVGSFTNLSNSSNSAGQQFNHTYSYFGNHITPGDTNKQGMDLDVFDVSSQMTNGQTSTQIKFGVVKSGSHCDQIFPQVIAFSTQLYEPKFCYDYSVEQDGSYLNLDRNLSIPVITSYISDSDLDVAVYIRNEEADIAADSISIRTDINESNHNVLFSVDETIPVYSSNVNGSVLIPRGSGPIIDPTCDYNASSNNAGTNVGCTNNSNLRKGLGSLDAKDFIYTKFTLQSDIGGIEDVNASLGLTMDYKITVGGIDIIYNDYELGGNNIPICPVTTTYVPEWGQFNVIQSGQTTNNLHTQVSRKPFSVAVIFDSDLSTGLNDAPASDINTTVLVEIADMDAFGDINASCSNPDSGLSKQVVVPVNFTSGNWQASVTPQDADYYNFAVKNAAYRIWYFTDNNDTLLDWSAVANTNDTNVTSITGLYDSTIHTQCSTPCSVSTSTDCFSCIKDNYAKAICSRDNFSVRPESYDLHIFDINETNNVTNPNNINLSISEGFDANSPITINRLNVAAGYDYRYDINATGHDNTTAIPGYTRYFRGGSDFNTTLIWDPQTTKVGCNDTNDTDIFFYVGNGRMQNAIQDHGQVGAYRLNIVDTTWTAVDWDTNAHHAPANNNFSGDDCQSGLTYTGSIGRHGCNINTVHTNDGFGAYQDHDINYHPYQFGLNTNVTIGEDNAPISPANNHFIYMADIDKDENMSVQLNTTITAQGKNSASGLTNFVTGCYATPLDINITKVNVAPISNLLETKYKFNNYNNLGNKILTNEINSSIRPRNITGILTQDINITTPASYFQRNMNGTINTTTRVNFHREVNATANPERVVYSQYKVENSANRFYADLNITNMAQGFNDINATATQELNITHYYGRTAGKRTTIICNPANANCTSGGTEPDVFVYYEVFCKGTIGTNLCDPTLLPTDTLGNTQQRVDTRWFTNFDHNTTTYGELKSSVGSINPTFIILPHGVEHNNSYTVDSQHSYQISNGLPYRAVMDDNVSNWLVHDENNATEIFNTHTVIFRPPTEWSGVHEDDSTTKTQRVWRVNRRTMW